MDSSRANYQCSESSSDSIPLALFQESLAEEPSQQTFERNKTADKVIQVDIISQKRNEKLNASKIQAKRYLEKLQILQTKYDKAREQLNQYENNKHITAFLKVMQAASVDKDHSASLIIDLIENFGKKNPKYKETTIRECLMWRACSTKGYEYARQNLMLTLPSRTTLTRYMGNVSTINEVGVNSLIEGRIKAEVANFKVDQEKMCSLIIDEMSMQQRLVYDKKCDKFVGGVDYGDVKRTKKKFL